MGRKLSTAKKEKIIAAAVEVLNQKKMGEGFMDDVARKAGVAKGTLYLYFKNKEDLFCQMFLNFVTRICGIIDMVRESNLGARQSLYNLLEEFSSFLERYRRAFLALSLETGNVKESLHRQFHREFRRKILDLINALAPIMKKGVDNREFKKYHPQTLAAVFLSLLPVLAHATLRPWRFPDKMKVYIGKDILFRVILEGIGRKNG